MLLPSCTTCIHVQEPNDSPACGPCINVQRSKNRQAKPTTSIGSTLAGIGDINSDAKGSGARYNTGKPPLDLIPLRLLAESYRRAPDGIVVDFHAVDALYALGLWQERRGSLPDVLASLGNPWHECAHVFDYGRRKYAAWNWSKGMAWSIPMACAARHLEDMIVGITHDPESGRQHVGHVLCNWVMLATYAETFLEGDDRPPAGALSLDPMAAL